MPQVKARTLSVSQSKVRARSAPMAPPSPRNVGKAPRLPRSAIVEHLGAPSHLAVADPDVSRRAALSADLSNLAIRVEAFRSVKELCSSWKRITPILVQDTGDAVNKALDYCEIVGQWLPVIAYDEAPVTARVVTAMKQGAFDYLAWPFSAGQLNAILQSEHEMEHQSRRWARQHRARGQLGKLTAREMDVLKRLVLGECSREIADVFAISKRTVEVHRLNLMRKLDVDCTTHAVRIALDGGLSAELD